MRATAAAKTQTRRGPERVTFEDIETLVDHLYDMDATLCYDLGFAGGFQVPDDEEDRQHIVDDLEEAIAAINKEGAA